MHGYRTYAVKLFQSNKLEDFSALIKSGLRIDGQTNVNEAKVLTDEDYAEKSRALANGILNVTRDVNAVFDTQYEAQAAGEMGKGAILLALIELGYNIRDVQYVVTGDVGSYSLQWIEVPVE